MSTRPPNNSSGPLDHLSLRYLRQVLDMSHPADEPYVLNTVENRVIRRAKVVTLLTAAILGISGVMLFYWPQYTWPDLFSTTAIPVFGTVYELPLITACYSLLLVYLEVNLLLAINLWGVKEIMDVCQFPKAHDAQYERHLQSLTKAAIEKSQQGILRFSLDPYLNLPRWGLTIFFLINSVKAVLSSLLLKVAMKPFLGWYALRPVTDMTSMPIYALWNTWASWQTLHEAQIRVMAPITIREFVHELHEEWGKNDQFRPLILESLHYISITKRQFNYAHFMLTETLVDRFDLSVATPPSGNFMEQLLQAPVAVRRSLERLIVFGVLVDGKLSWLEKRRLRELRKKGILSYSTSEIQRMGTDYNQGRGLWV